MAYDTEHATKVGTQKEGSDYTTDVQGRRKGDCIINGLPCLFGAVENYT